MLKMKLLSSWLKIIILLTIFFSKSIAQSQTMPVFSIAQSNGKTLNTAQLPKTKPVILIYFSPDCDHCTTLLNAMFKQMDQFNKATILLVTFRPMNEITEFEKKYKTTGYKNIIVGMEQPVFFLKNLYQLQSTPFTALFNKNGNLVYSYKKETPVNELVMRLKKTCDFFFVI